jgi:hypothetical protein
MLYIAAAMPVLRLLAAPLAAGLFRLGEVCGVVVLCCRKDLNAAGQLAVLCCRQKSLQSQVLAADTLRWTCVTAIACCMQCAVMLLLGACMCMHYICFSLDE